MRKEVLKKRIRLYVEHIGWLIEEGRKYRMDRNVIKFHLEPKLMELFLRVSHHAEIPGGGLCRQWLQWLIERLKKEMKDSETPKHAA
jgi:hypothetical protein